MKGLIIATTLFFFVVNIQAQVLSVQEQAQTINEVLNDRIDNLLPKLMDETNIDNTQTPGYLTGNRVQISE